MTAPLEPAASTEEPPATVVAPSTTGKRRRLSTPIPSTGLPRALILLLGIAAAVIAVAGIKAIAWLVGPVFLALIIVIAAARCSGGSAPGDGPDGSPRWPWSW